MASNGDTITYTYSDGTSVSEDVSSVDEAVVDYCDSAGGTDGVATAGGSGGRVENATIDVSSISTLYIWVADRFRIGRYNGVAAGSFGEGNGGGSTEIAKVNTSSADSDDEPFLVASAGGGGGIGEYSETGGDGARGGNAQGIAPPAGGGSEQDGEGAIDDQNRGLVSGGTTITGGGSGPDTNGEIQVTYKNSVDIELNWTDNSTNENGFRIYRSTNLPATFPDDFTQVAETSANVTTFTDTAPKEKMEHAVTAFTAGGESAPTRSTIDPTISPPTNLSVTNSSTEDELTLSWDPVSSAAGYYIYRAQSTGSTKGQYTQVADVTSGTSYTDTNLEDGENYYYRVTSHS
jgi:Fibronectin type III domain.